MNLKNISIRSRFSLLLVGTAFFWLFAGFLILSLVTELSRYQDTSNDILSLPQKILRLENAIHSFYINDLRSESFHESGRADGISRFNSTYLDTYTLVRDLKSEPILSREYMIQQKLDHLMEYLIITNNYIETLAGKARERGWHSYGLSGVILEQVEELNIEDSPVLGQPGRELLTELQLYLVFPGSGHLNSLQNKVLYIFYNV